MSQVAQFLRGALSWRDGRAHVDLMALFVLADWLEEAGRQDEADEVRRVLRPLEGPSLVERANEFDVSFADNAGPKTYYEFDASRGTVKLRWNQYEQLDYIALPRGGVPPTGPDPAELERIFYLARWHVIAVYLGWPPLRLASGE